MKSNILLVALLCLSVSCNAQTSNEKSLPLSDTSDYPKEIVQLGIEKLYDKCKWQLYTNFADDTLMFNKKTGIIDDSTTGGMLPLRLDQLRVSGDTTEIKCLFYYNGQEVNYFLIYNAPTWGCLFIGEKIIMMSSKGEIAYSGSLCENISDCPDLADVPLRAEFIEYLRSNKDKIDPWLRKEAIRRGIINK